MGAPAKGADARQAVLHVLRAGRNPRPAPRTQEWIDKYKGKFDQGWDKLREEIFARQKELGVIPGDAELTKRPEEIPAWDQMPKELRPILARQMEIYRRFSRAHRPPRGPAGRCAGGLGGTR